MDRDLNFTWRFKGSRDYLQGADLHDGICAALARHGVEELEGVELAMHAMARESLSGSWVDAATPPAEGTVAVFKFTHGDRRQAVHLRSNGQPVNLREPFAEEEIVAASTLDLTARSIALRPLAQFSNLEQIVALNKRLLQQLHPEAPGKWIFTSLKTPRSLWLPRWQHLELRFELAFQFALTRTLILADGAEAGRIFFSLLT